MQVLLADLAAAAMPFFTAKSVRILNQVGPCQLWDQNEAIRVVGQLSAYSSPGLRLKLRVEARGKPQGSIQFTQRLSSGDIVCQPMMNSLNRYLVCKFRIAATVLISYPHVKSRRTLNQPP